MYTEEIDSTIKKALKNLCCNNGWSYGVFWRFDQRNTLLLTMQDAYYEEQMGGVIDDMLLQVHMLGGGIIGQTAFTKKQRWMFSDSHYSVQNSVGWSEDIFQDDSEFHRQFSSGIKTIVVISVEPGGVVQFGSTQKILERAEFVDQTKRVFREMENGEGRIFSENVPSSSNSDSYATSGLFASLISSGNSCLSTSPTWFSTTNVNTQVHNSGREAQVALSNNSNSQLHQPLLESTSHFNSIAAEPPCNSTWSNLESTLCTFDEFFQAVDCTTENDDLFSQPMGLFSVSSSLKEDDNPTSVPLNCPANSLQSSITSTFDFDGNEKCSNNSCVENNVFDSFVVDFDNILTPIMNGGHLNFNTETSECISEQNVGPRKRLFSKLGIEELLDGLSGSSNVVYGSSFEDRLSFTRRRTDSSLGSSDQLAGLPCFAGSTTSSKSVYNVGPKVGPKLEAGSWIGDRYSMNVEPKKNVEPAKTTKRKAKPGTRPRPKDRQLIQDRVSELRQLIPNGEKMSIDCLLDRTIKHMLFLQNVTKHADRLKQANKPKENGPTQRDNSGGGVTWACEVGDQTMVCPLIVEDLSSPGQMLIEMLCEEQGFFLEIVDIIQGFGLNILKGVMEACESKIWARFIVEAEGNRHVTRHEIFSALVQLIQFTAPNAVNLSDQVGNVIDERTNQLNNFQQSVVPLPVSLAETLGYTSL
ncbi:hypothetical protein LguiB_034874 [Lonicera macranthoides]